MSSARIHAKGTKDHTKSPSALSHVFHAHSFTSSWKIASNQMHPRNPFLFVEQPAPEYRSKQAATHRHTMFCFISFHWIIVNKKTKHFIIMLSNFINPTSFSVASCCYHLFFVNYCFPTSHSEYARCGGNFKRIKLFITNQQLPETPFPLFPF